MRLFGSSITYKVVNLINLYSEFGKENFEYYRDKYLVSENEEQNSNLYKMTSIKMEKLIKFISNHIDSLTCENEMKMECFFNQDEPAFVNDEVNTKIFNFEYADLVYEFAMKNHLHMRMHTIVWYRHFPSQLKDYLEGRSSLDKKNLTLKFIKVYMEELNKRYPCCYCVDVINEMASDPDELRIMKEEGEPLYEVDPSGIRIDDWYRYLGKDYYIEVFMLAREVFGDEKKLFYNDNNEGNKEKQEIYLRVINKIKEFEKNNGIKLLDGFGLQFHCWGDESREYLESIFEFYTKLDLEIQITEFDVSNHEGKERQVEVFRDFIKVVKDYNVFVFTMWGLNDELSWLGEFEPLLVDSNYDIKDFAKDYIEYFSSK